MSTDRDQSSSLHREHGPVQRSARDMLRDDIVTAGRSTRGPTETDIPRGGRRQSPFSDGPESDSDTERELRMLRVKVDEMLRRQKQIMWMLAAEDSAGIDDAEWEAAYRRRYDQ